MKIHKEIFWFMTFFPKNDISAKPFCIRFDKVDGFVRVCDGTICSVLFGGEICDLIYNRIRHLIGVNKLYYVRYF